MRYKRQYTAQQNRKSGKRSSPAGEPPAAGITPTERGISAGIQVLTGGILIFIFLWIVWLA